MKNYALAAVTVAALLLSACTDQYGRPQQGGVNKEGVGTVLGAIGGGILGSQIGHGAGRTTAIIGGSLLGGMLGNGIGASLDRADMQYYNQTSQRALETAQPGQSLPWSNPQTGNSGSVTPQAYYQAPDGQYCREYTQTINVGGKVQKGYGKACRQPDGSWQIAQ